MTSPHPTPGKKNLLPIQKKTPNFFWRWLLWVYAGVVCVLSIVPVTISPPGRLDLDKLVHVCEYGLFAWLMIKGLSFSWRPTSKIVGTWVSATGYGALMELLQMMLPWRSAAAGDIIANAIGAALGTWLAVRKR